MDIPEILLIDVFLPFIDNSLLFIQGIIHLSQTNKFNYQLFKNIINKLKMAYEFIKYIDDDDQLLLQIIEKYKNILTSKESYELEKKHIERLLNQKVDGIFISLSEETYNTQHLNSIIDSNVILIQYDKISKLIDSSKVVIDDREAAYLATQHLIDKGKKRIVHLRGPLIPQVAIDRFLGYKSALQDSGIPFDRSLVLTCPHGDDEEGFDQLKSLHEENISFDGVFAHADLVAVGALRYLKRKKLRSLKKWL